MSNQHTSTLPAVASARVDETRARRRTLIENEIILEDGAARETRGAPLDERGQR